MINSIQKNSVPCNKLRIFSFLLPADECLAWSPKDGLYNSSCIHQRKNYKSKPIINLKLHKQVSSDVTYLYEDILKINHRFIRTMDQCATVECMNE